MKDRIEKLHANGRLTNAGIADAIVRGWMSSADAVELLGEADGLAAAKAARIQMSKTALAKYLAATPLQWTDGEYYSITSDKQQQLASKIMAATMAQTLPANYTLTWNSTGEVCKEWTLQDLSALAFAIDARVTKLVGYQQAQEVAMRNAETLDELNAIEVDYDAVS